MAYLAIEYAVIFKKLRQIYEYKKKISGFQGLRGRKG